MIPRILIENLFFEIHDLFAVFGTDKAFALIFDLRSVEEATYTEESGLFGHNKQQQS